MTAGLLSFCVAELFHVTPSSTRDYCQISSCYTLNEFAADSSLFASFFEVFLVFLGGVYSLNDSLVIDTTNVTLCTDFHLSSNDVIITRNGDAQISLTCLKCLITGLSFRGLEIQVEAKQRVNSLSSVTSVISQGFLKLGQSSVFSVVTMERLLINQKSIGVSISHAKFFTMDECNLTSSTTLYGLFLFSLLNSAITNSTLSANKHAGILALASNVHVQNKYL